MNHLLFFLYFMLFLISGLSHSSDLDKITKNKGCPYNSTCSKSQGAQRFKWKKYLEKSPSSKKLTSFIKKNGTPFRFFVLSEQKENPFVSWDSRCSTHNLKDKKVFIGQKFIKNINDLKEYKDHIYIPQIHILNAKKEIVSIPIPQGVFPSYLEGNALSTTMDFEGHYYNLKTYSNGHLQVFKAHSFDKHPEKMKCPQKLLKHVKTSALPVKLEAHFYCRNIWDKKIKSFVPALFADFCQ